MPPNTFGNEHTNTDILQPEEPKTLGILVPIASTLAINRPLSAASGNSKGGDSGGSSAALMNDHMGFSDENDENESEDEDVDNPPVAIDKSKRSAFTRDSAGLDGNLVSAWVAPAGSHRRRSGTDHRRQRSSQLEIKSADAG